MNGLLCDEACRRQPLLELGAVAGRTGTVQQPHEVFEQSVGPSQRDKCEAVSAPSKQIAAFEVAPEISNRFPALFIARANRKRPLHLTSQLAFASGGIP